MVRGGLPARLIIGALVSGYIMALLQRSQPGFNELHAALFHFPDHNMRRDFWIPAAQMVMPFLLLGALFRRSNSRGK